MDRLKGSSKNNPWLLTDRGSLLLSGVRKVKPARAKKWKRSTMAAFAGSSPYNPWVLDALGNLVLAGSVDAEEKETAGVAKTAVVAKTVVASGSATPLVDDAAPRWIFSKPGDVPAPVVPGEPSPRWVYCGPRKYVPEGELHRPRYLMRPNRRSPQLPQSPPRTPLQLPAPQSPPRAPRVAAGDENLPPAAANADPTAKAPRSPESPWRTARRARRQRLTRIRLLRPRAYTP
ncbi:hypothetical protein C8R46DRAFT_1231117 [Mycena filopes]|nr:hypothetical protein C8R46DRAFT_1231117 [Mycena filopes]